MNRAKLIDGLLIMAIVFLAYQFGFSVGDYYARSVRARQDAREILDAVERTFKPDEKKNVDKDSES